MAFTSLIDLTFKSNLLMGEERRYVIHIHKFNLKKLEEAFV
jgi:hypothetical protein